MGAGDGGDGWKPMQIIPVIDIRNGVAVRAVAGERAMYRPVSSRLTASAEPAEVLKSLQLEFELEACYVADLDGIERGQINRCTLAEMARTGARLIVDAGIRCTDAAQQLLEIGVAKVVVSSESLPDLEGLSDFITTCGAANIVFSVDLKHGKLLVADSSWRDRPPADLVLVARECGVQQLLVLDLAAVGTGTGIPTLQFCQDIRTQWPDVTLISGGGVHSADCLKSAEAAGLDGLLIASALHDGRIQKHDLLVHTRRTSGY